MQDDHDNSQTRDDEKRRTILDMLITRQEPDKDYLPDLRSQWEIMDSGERLKFVIGSLFGLVIFIGALLLVYFALAAIIS